MNTINKLQLISEKSGKYAISIDINSWKYINDNCIKRYFFLRERYFMENSDLSEEIKTECILYNNIVEITIHNREYHYILISATLEDVLNKALKLLDNLNKMWYNIHKITTQSLTLEKRNEYNYKIRKN